MMSTRKTGILACALLVACASFLGGVHCGIAFKAGTTERTRGLRNSSVLPPVLRPLQQDYGSVFSQIIQYFNASMSSNTRRLERVEAQNAFLIRSITDLLVDDQEPEDSGGSLDSIKILQTHISSLNEDLAKLQVEGMLNNPMARLFSGENFTGEAETYTFARAKFEGGCHDLVSLKERVKSVDTFGSCIRLFSDPGCDGWSAAVYPGSDNSNSVLSSKLTKVVSVGPCISNEFAPFVSKRPGHNEIFKHTSDLKTYVPDLVEFFSFDKFVRRNGSSTLGPQNRVEFVQAVFLNKLQSATQPDVEMEQNDFYQSLQKEPGDVVGYMHPKSLGGPSQEWNVFPQTPAGKEEWSRTTSEIRPYLERKESKWVSLATNVMYANESSTRPYAFYYSIKYDNKRLSYGRIAN